MIVNKPVELTLLEQEMNAAQVPINGLGSRPVPGGTEVFTYSSTGVPVEIPASGIPVVNAHVAPTPGRYDARTFIKEAHTTDGTPAVVTFPVAENTGYIGTVYVLGVQDVSPFNRRTERKAVMVARRTANAVLDGQEDLHTPFIRGSSAWTVVLGVSGPNVTVTLTGVVGVTIDWTIWGEFFRFNKDGLKER